MDSDKENDNSHLKKPLKGMNLDDAKDAYNNLRQKLAPYTFGFEIPKKISTKITKRRLSHWEETDIPDDNLSVNKNFESTSPSTSNDFHNNQKVESSENNDTSIDEPSKSVESGCEAQGSREMRPSTHKKHHNKKKKSLSSHKSSWKVINKAVQTISKHSSSSSISCKKRRATSLPDDELSEEVDDCSHENKKQRKDQWNFRSRSVSQLLFTNYFQIVESNGSRTRAKCKNCPADRPLLSGQTGINSNFKEHLRTVSFFSNFLLLCSLILYK